MSLNLTFIRTHSTLNSFSLPVALDQGYNKSVDVYSFGILLWEILSLEKPFKCYGSKKHLALVIEGGERPKIDTHLPVNLQWLMKSCWSTCPQDRPSFDAARSTLLDVLEDLSSSTTPVRTRSHSTGSHNDAGGSPMRRPPQSDKAKTLSPVFEAIKIPAGLGGLRVRSLGLKRGHS
jgi:serine/threonine protein kinase